MSSSSEIVPPSVTGEPSTIRDQITGGGAPAPDHNHVPNQGLAADLHNDVDLYIPSRNQRIPGKFLLPPPSVRSVNEQVEDETPIPEIIPGMGKREFMR